MPFAYLARLILIGVVAAAFSPATHAQKSPTKSTKYNADEALIITLKRRGSIVDAVWKADSKTNVEYVDTLSASLVDNSDLKTISQFNRLRELSCVGTFSKHGVEFLRGLSNLERLQVNSKRLADNSIAVFAEITTLQRLDIRRISTTAEIDLQPLLNLKKLRELKLPSTEFIGDSQIEIITGLKELVSIHISDCSISDAGLAHVLKFEKLIALNIAGNSVTSEGVAKLAKLKHLKYINLDGIRINEPTIRLLTNDAKIQRIVIPYEMGKRNGG